MKYLSLFTGIGGFELGINQAYEKTKNCGLVRDGKKTNTISGGYETEHGSGMGDKQTKRPNNEFDESAPTCIGFSEIDKYAAEVYSKHFPTHKNYGDITKINEKELPDFDLLVGGFPCQSFSIAGKRGGFSDTRGTLFFDIARILKCKKPKLFLLENVKGLLSHDEGRTFGTIIATLDELGYDLQWQVLNSKNHGVPQNRERVFIVGHLRGTSRPEVFPFTESSQNPDESDTKNTSQQFGEIRETEISPTLRTPTGGNRLPFIMNPKMLNYKKDYENSVAITATSYKEPPVVNAIRRLTPIECERLQGFPDNWTSEVSDTQRYKCCGNAVTVNVIKDIMEKLI